MIVQRLITPQLLSQLMLYDPETGLLTWKHRSPDLFIGGMQSPEHSCKIWNSRNAGRQAFTSTNKNGYFHGAVFGTTLTAHKVAWAIFYGKFHEKTLDHINGKRTDNRIENLRDVSIAENSKNHTISVRNTSGVTGVHLNKATGKWVASIKGDGRMLNLGYFSKKEDAITARKSAEQRFGFHKNHGKAAA